MNVSLYVFDDKTSAASYNKGVGQYVFVAADPPAPRINTSTEYESCVQIVRKLSGFAILLVDLKYAEADLDKDELVAIHGEELFTLVEKLVSDFENNQVVSPGFCLVREALMNQVWRGG